MNSNMTQDQIEEYKNAFKFFDKDGSEQISTEELGDAMSKLGYNLTNEQVAIILNQVDTDGSGQIGFDEFLQFINKANA